MTAISAPQDRARSFEENRGCIWRVAYRMLGSRAEGDDVVQDACLRWHHATVEEIRTHDRNAMLQLLAREATWTADGGGTRGPLSRSCAARFFP
jgi:DNA-directed RNA polymerase specialized sigma24 family protein